MELDELKNKLNKQLETDHLQRTEADIAALLKKKAHSALSKIRRSLWFEITFSVAFTALLIYVAFASKYQSLRIYSASFSVIMLLITGVLFFLLKKINLAGSSNLPIRENLQNIVVLMDEFIRRYFQFCIFLLPVCIIFSASLQLHEKESIVEMDAFFRKIRPQQSYKLLVILLYMVGSFAGLYYLTKWYLKKLYGNFVAQLKDYIRELEETEKEDAAYSGH
jgi:SpoVK/Ycf46/Vps4 family AAA+-type ATPase